MSLWPEDYVEVSALFSWFPLHFRGCQVVTCWHFGEISYIWIMGISPAPIGPSPNNLLLTIGHDERERIIIHFGGSPNFYTPITMNVKIRQISVNNKLYTANFRSNNIMFWWRNIWKDTPNTYYKHSPQENDSLPETSHLESWVAAHARSQSTEWMCCSRKQCAKSSE